jgi:hypothetical protein
MNAISFGAIARERLDIVPYRPKADNSPDAARVVLEAANDLGDDATIDACRRVIDANLNGAPASQSDLHIILDYFR